MHCPMLVWRRFGFPIASLVFVGALAVLVFFLVRSVQRQNVDAVTHGPIVGAVTATDAKVFVRTLTDAQVRIRYSTDPNFATFLESATISTFSGSDWTAQIPLTKLEPQTVYYLDVLVDNVLQANRQGQFKTFQVSGSKKKIRFVVLTDFGSLGLGEQPPLPDPSPVFAGAAAENPDFIFIGGDFDHRNARDLDDKRQMFKDLYALDNPRAPMNDFVTKILPRFALAHQWDDHDYAGNDSNRFALDRFLAKQVYTEYFPAYPYGGTSGIYQKFTDGDADFFVLDERTQRDPNEQPDSEIKSMLDGEHLGADGQLAWLKQGLKQSTATWKIIFSSSVFNPTIGKMDSWHAFRNEHDEIVNLVKQNKIAGVIVISGDIHIGAMDNGHNAGLPTMVVPGVNLKYCSTVPQHSVGKWTEGLYGDPARNQNDAPCNGYGIVTLKPKRAVLRINNEKGKTKLKMSVLP